MTKRGYDRPPFSCLVTVMIIFVYLVVSWPSCDAFVATTSFPRILSLVNGPLKLLPQPHHQRGWPRLFGMLPRFGKDGTGAGNGKNNADGDEAVEAERKRLENLLGETRKEAKNQSPSSAANSKKARLKTSLLPLDWNEQLADPPPLTAIGRERIETEIALLESLKESDDAVEELWNLWYFARGAAQAAALIRIDQWTSQGPEGWPKAEQALRKLIVQEGMHWAEPVNRLATLLFLQGRYEESKEACEAVLTIKPWHFGALSGITMVCQRLQDKEAMMHWAMQRMPPLGLNSLMIGDQGGVVLESRADWVDRMVKIAKGALECKEKDLQDSFRQDDIKSAFLHSRDDENLLEEDSSAWQ